MTTLERLAKKFGEEPFTADDASSFLKKDKSTTHKQICYWVREGRLKKSGYDDGNYQQYAVTRKEFAAMAKAKEEKKAKAKSTTKKKATPKNTPTNGATDNLDRVGVARLLLGDSYEEWEARVLDKAAEDLIRDCINAAASRKS